ncbi:MAG: rhomboid family intramembrane serine protease [Cytophagales bacterium]
MQPRNLSPTVTKLLIANAIFSLVFNFLYIPALQGVYSKLSLHLFNSPEFIPTQLVTYLFVHGDIGHFISNMLGLIVCGTLLETFWGEKKFIIFYLVTGIGAGIVFNLVRYYEYHDIFSMIDAFLKSPNPDSFDLVCRKYYTINSSFEFTGYVQNFYNQPTQLSAPVKVVHSMQDTLLSGSCVGASGAIFGLLFAIAYYFPNTEFSLMFIPINIKAKYMVFLLGLYEITSGVYKIPGDKVAHWGHLGGIIFAYILIHFWQKSRKSLY